METELKTQYFVAIAKMSDIEGQITRKLPKMIEQVSSDELRECLTNHLEETKVQRLRLEQIIERHGELLDLRTVESFELMLEEAEAEMTLITDEDVRDAHIIASASVVEHLEMSLYETLYEWAKQLDETADCEVFNESRNEEASMADKLSTLASGGLFTKGLVAEAVH